MMRKLSIKVFHTASLNSFFYPPPGLKALHFHLQPEGMGLLHGGDALRGAVVRLGAGARENRGTGRGERRDCRSQITETGGVALL